MQNEMRDRLIDLIKSADISLFGTDKSFAEVYADHLIASGVILLPCKIGDIVYRNSDFWWIDYGDISAYQITNLTITQNKKGLCIY